jgi:hypothetical protein
VARGAWWVVRGCVVRGAWSVVRGAWCVVRGAWCVVRGAWCVVRGAWCVVRGAWCVVRGAWCVARGAWCLRACVRRGRACQQVVHLRHGEARQRIAVHLLLLLLLRTGLLFLLPSDQSRCLISHLGESDQAQAIAVLAREAHDGVVATKFLPCVLELYPKEALVVADPDGEPAPAGD